MRLIRTIIPVVCALSTQLVSAFPEKPHAYFYAFAAGSENRQTVIRLPMQLDQHGKLNGKKAANGLGQSGHDWEVVGRYQAECPHNDPRDRSAAEGPSAKKQNMLVLEDGTILFTCERSNIVVVHPQSSPDSEINQLSISKSNCRL